MSLDAASVWPARRNVASIRAKADRIASAALVESLIWSSGRLLQATDSAVGCRSEAISDAATEPITIDKVSRPDQPQDQDLAYTIYFDVHAPTS
jgi:hypothetical protein